jgi:hypothetical protein
LVGLGFRNRTKKKILEINQCNNLSERIQLQGLKNFEKATGKYLYLAEN